MGAQVLVVVVVVVDVKTLAGKIGNFLSKDAKILRTEFVSLSIFHLFIIMKISPRRFV